MKLFLAFYSIRFSTWLKWRQKVKYLENEKRFSGKKKAFSVIFKGLPVIKNYLRPGSAPLNSQALQLYFNFRLETVQLLIHEVNSVPLKVYLTKPPKLILFTENTKNYKKYVSSASVTDLVKLICGKTLPLTV